MQKVLIVGAGLSGCCLAHEFIRNNVQVTLVDNGYNNSSTVAAGMINPLVFRRMTKSWRVDEFLPTAIHFYKEIEASTQTSFLDSITIRRFFSSEQERNFWITKQNSIDFCDYMAVLNEDDARIHPDANEFGSGRVKNAWHVNASVFLPAIKNSLNQSAEWINEEFDFSRLDETKGFYQNIEYDLIVFAQGYLGVSNPLFNKLILTQTKGETLTVKIDELETTESLNRKCFVLPMGDNEYKIGSTYTWDTDDINPTIEGKNTILENLKYITKGKVTVLNHDAGIRPTTNDRRPIIGVHPMYSKLAIFNGMGAKGYLLAPQLAKDFVHALLKGGTMPKECEISNRTFKSHLMKS
jgi:glycine/D-amino acid oxidase-like deaminating enzyme